MDGVTENIGETQLLDIIGGAEDGILTRPLIHQDLSMGKEVLQEDARLRVVQVAIVLYQIIQTVHQTMANGPMIGHRIMTNTGVMTAYRQDGQIAPKAIPVVDFLK
tara:strand:- start:121 stop:438 length:318 start_codon:yes stop_codon:yes gene_type:complete